MSARKIYRVTKIAEKNIEVLATTPRDALRLAEERGLFSDMDWIPLVDTSANELSKYELAELDDKYDLVWDEDEGEWIDLVDAKKAIE